MQLLSAGFYARDWYVLHAAYAAAVCARISAAVGVAGMAYEAIEPD